MRRGSLTEMVVVYGFPVTYTVSVHLLASYFAELWTVWAWHVSSINEKIAAERGYILVDVDFSGSVPT